MPPFPTATVPEVMFEPLKFVNPDPLPVKIFEPILILPKPLPIEPEVSVPTEARLEAEVRPASVVIFGNDVVAARTAIAVVEARELVKKRLFDPSVKSFVLILRDDVAIVPTDPFVPQSRPFNEPMLKALANRFVEEAVVAKKFVEVALPKIDEAKFAIVEYRLVEVEFAATSLFSVVVPVTPKLPPMVCPPETSDPTVRAPPTEASPETARLETVVVPAESVPPIVVLLETFKDVPLKSDVPPVMAEPIAKIYAAVTLFDTADTALPMDVPIESA